MTPSKEPRPDTGGGPTIVVTGANGSLGRVVCARLLDSGYRVRGLDRSGAAPGLAGRPGFTGHRVDVTDTTALLPLFEGAFALVHCAGLNPDRLDEGREAFYRSNVVAAVSALEAASARGLARAVMISTVGVLRRDYHGVVDDDTDWHPPSNHYHWSKVEGEKRVLDFPAREGLAITILRPCSLYGAGVRYKWPDIVRLTRRGRMRLIGRGDGAYPLVHIEDVARAIACVLAAAPGTLHQERITLVSPEPLTIAHILNFIADRLGARRPRRIPYLPVLWASIVLDVVPDRLKPPLLRQIEPHNIRDYCHSLRFDPTKAERLLGFRAEIPFERAMTEMLERMDTDKAR